LLRDVPWRWRDVLIGLAPLVLAIAASALLRATAQPGPGPRLGLLLTLAAEIWMFGYPLAVARRRAGSPWRLQLPRPRAAAVELLVALVCLPPVVIGMGVVALAASLLLGDPGPGPSGPLGPLVSTLDRGEIGALVALAVIAAPLGEEVFFRGMLFGSLRQRLPLVAAVVLQAVVFGLLHPYGRAAAVAIALAGVVLALLYRWRRTLLTPILMHAMVNAVGMVMMFWALAADAGAPRLGVVSEAAPGGCRILRVAPGSGAEAAGLRPGDVITAVDGIHVFDQQTLTRTVRERQVGEEAEIDFRRGGEERVVDVLLKSLEELHGALP
jgi:membrane protease YdiL (CAAX protease family)